MEWLVFGAGGWEESACHPVWLAENAEPIFDDSGQTRQEIIDLIWRECGDQGDMIRQLATVLVNHGYRKFEIVEEDV